MINRGIGVGWKAVVLATVTLLGAGWGADAQSTGFLVLPGIDNGPADVYVDGVRRGSLNRQEFTLQIPAGVRRIEVMRTGYAVFQRDISVPAGDVVQLQVRLIPAQVQVVEDAVAGGTAEQRTGHVRAIHLDPVRVPIEVDGTEVGETPATLSIPVGERRIRIGSHEVCVFVDEGADSRIRVRSGRVEEIHGMLTCEEAAFPIVISGLPREVSGGSALTVTVDGRSTAQSRVSWRGSNLVVRSSDPGTRMIELRHPEYLSLGFDITASHRDSVLVQLDLGTRKPRLTGTPDILDLGPRPVRPEFSPPRFQSPPTLPNDAEKRRAEARLAEGRLHRSGRTRHNAGWGLVAVGTLAGLIVGSSDDTATSGAGLGLFVGSLVVGTLVSKSGWSQQAQNRPCDAPCRTEMAQIIRRHNEEVANFPGRYAQWEEAAAEFEATEVVRYRRTHEESVKNWEQRVALWEERRQERAQVESQLRVWQDQVERTRRAPRVRVVPRR